MPDDRPSDDPGRNNPLGSINTPAPPERNTTRVEHPVDQALADSLTGGPSSISAFLWARVAETSFGAGAAALVSEAEQAASYRWLDDGYDDELVAVDQLPAFINEAIARAGFGCEGPTVELDVPDDSPFSGWYSQEEDVMHLHPRLLHRATVLHELAHWGRPDDGHGPQFRALLVSLIRAQMGSEHADILLAEFSERGLPVDPGWL